MINKSWANKATFECGRRLERLYFFGIFIWSVAIINTFVNTAALQLNDDMRVSYLRGIDEWLKISASTLAEQYKFGKLTAAEKAKALKDWKDYPTLIEAYSKDYLSSLIEILERVEKRYPAPSIQIENDVRELFAQGLPPSAVHERLGQMLRTKPTKLQLATVDLPIELKVDVLGSKLGVPLVTIALLLHVTLVPIIIVWAGAIYVTRLRELLAIRSLGDPIYSFPHILNRIRFHFAFDPWVARRTKLEKLLARPQSYSASLLRSFLVLFFILPPLVLHFHATYFLYESFAFGNFFIFILVSLGYGSILIHALVIAALEFHPSLRFPVSYVD